MCREKKKSPALASDRRSLGTRGTVESIGFLPPRRLSAPPRSSPGGSRSAEKRRFGARPDACHRTAESAQAVHISNPATYALENEPRAVVSVDHIDHADHTDQVYAYPE